MSLLLAEAIADRTIAYIRENAAAKIADVSGRGWDVELEMTDFQAIRLSDPDREFEPEFPVLYVSPDRSTVKDPSKGGGSFNGAHAFEFTVLAFHQGQGSGEQQVSPAEAVKRLTARYLIAVYELLEEMYEADSEYYLGGQRLYWGSGEIEPEFEYGLTVTSGSGEYMADARLLISIEHMESL